MGTFSFAGRWGPEAIIDRFGNAQASASVKVYESDGVTLSTLYTDRTKGTTNSNPFAPDARANATFFANPGPHVLKVTVGSSVTTLNIDVPIDPDEATTDSEATAAIAAHAALATGVHGVGASTVESASGAQAKVDVAQAAAIAAAAIDATTKANAAAAASQPLDSDLTAIALLSTTTYGRALLALADAAAGRTALGLGTAALSAATDFQPVDSDLTAIAALSTTSFGRSFLDRADAAAGRTLLGLGTAATTDSSTYVASGVAGAKLTAATVAPTNPATHDVWLDESFSIGSGCRAYLSTGSQTLTTATHTAVTFDAEEFDDAGYHDLVTNTSRMTVAVTGRYRLVCQCEFAGNATGYRFVGLWKNGVGTGTRLAQVNYNPIADGSTPSRIQCMTGPITLTAGDYVEMGVWQNSGGNLAAQALQGEGSTFLAIERVL